MKTDHINELISNPGQVSADDLAGLRQLVRDYPWCQSFQILYAKALKLDDDPTFNKQLKKTAIYATDRKVLYRLIMQPGLQKSIAEFETLVAEPEKQSVVPETQQDSIPTPEEAPVTEEKTDSAEPETAEKESPEEKTTSEPEIQNLPESPGTDEAVEENEASEAKETDPEADKIDSRNLEQEVLKEVAARAFQLQFESESPTEPGVEEESEIQSPSAPEPEPNKSSQPLTFLDFITGKSSAAPAPEASQEKSPEEATEETSLIDRFIKNEPKIERKKSSFFSPVNMGKMSLVDNDEMVSETLAAIYAKQGDTEKAKKAYQQLALKYPEKSIYFAGLIKKLERSGK